MPNAYIDGPKIESVETKRALIKEVTDAMEKAYKFPLPGLCCHHYRKSAGECWSWRSADCG